jgi:hypothetical protein
MPQTLPIRNLGDVGVVTDQDPSNLPVQVFTRAKNVRFDENTVVRAPVFRKVQDSLGFSPIHMYGVTTDSGYNNVLLVSEDFTIKSYANGNLTNVRSGSSTASDTIPVTATHLANQVYVNRTDEVPQTSPIDSLSFVSLANFQGPNNEVWKCASLRAYGDFLIALNMAEGPSTYPNRIRFSDLTQANSVPSTWDASDTTKSAGFIDLVEMKTSIIDGLPLGNNFIIYSKDQVWMMDFVGGTFIMNTRKLFSDTGVMSHNCVVEVERKHYVFAENDIYIHDGNSRKSIVDGRIKNYIFNGLDNDSTHKCFVHHNPDINEVYFCYKTDDDMAEYTNSDGCNRAAVYNYRNDTWSFMDLPNLNSGTIANINSTATYSSAASSSYQNFGGTYASQAAGFDKHTLFCGSSSSNDGITSDKMYGLDGIENGTLSFDLDTEANKPAFLQRHSIDLDELSTLSGYKVISAMLPQITTPSPNKTYKFNFGASNILSQNPTYETTAIFDASTAYKIDTRASGRYLSYKMTMDDYKDFAFIGFDAQVTVTGRR